MTIARIEAALPWGLHDALLQRLTIDWPRAKLTLTVRVKVTERQDFDRCGEIEVGGLVFCAIDAPEIDPQRHYQPIPRDGLWIDAGEGAAKEEARARLPEIPEGCFLHWIFARDWNRFIHICGRKANFEWTEPQPVRRRAVEASVAAEPEQPGVDPLLDLVNSELSAVVFVRDYVQLQFDGPTINALTPITVCDKDIMALSGDANFRNVLCAQISKSVANAHVQKGDALTITFSDNARIAISLKEQDYTGPEAAVIMGKASRCVVL